jgi:hypothetical protein
MRSIFVVAPGPSLADVDAELLRGQTVIAVKRAVFKFPWAIAVVSCHLKGFYDRPDVVAFCRAHPDVRPVFLRNRFEPSIPAGAVEGLEIWEDAGVHGLCKKPRHLANGGNSGHTAVNLAWHELRRQGATRIVLVGFDMRVVAMPDGTQKSHFDREGVHALDLFYSDFFVKSFRHIAADLAREGVDVVNATPNSRLDVFPRADLRALLQQPLDQE